MLTSTFKFGKLPPITDPSVFKLEKYITPGLPALPTEIALQNAVSISTWGNMGSGPLKDCTCAAAGHLIMAWTANVTGVAKVIPTLDIIKAYSAVSGYNPQNGDNDGGAYCLKVLKLWSSVGIGGDIIKSYVKIKLKNAESLKQAVYLFGGCYVGLKLPNNKSLTNGVWDIDATAPKGDRLARRQNGHCVPVIGYNATSLAFVTWGTLQFMTWDFYNTYCDEAYAILSPDWLNGTTNINGFNLAALEEDLKKLKNTSAQGQMTEVAKATQ